MLSYHNELRPYYKLIFFDRCCCFAQPSCARRHLLFAPFNLFTCVSTLSLYLCTVHYTTIFFYCVVAVTWSMHDVYPFRWQKCTSCVRFNVIFLRFNEIVSYLLLWQYSVEYSLVYLKAIHLFRSFLNHESLTKWEITLKYYFNCSIVATIYNFVKPTDDTKNELHVVLRNGRSVKTV